MIPMVDLKKQYKHLKVDIFPTTFNIDPQKIERKITKKTKSITFLM
jgi:dTDP-4-amino-4,6-dideoxygalactose transaminase